MKGTEKQIKFATDLMNEKLAKIAKFEAAGKGERFAKIKQVLAAINEDTQAGNVIDILNEQTPYNISSVEGGHITIERVIEFLHTSK